MTWTLVQSVGSGNSASGATLTATLTNPVTSGNAVLIAFTWGDTSTPSITDDVGGNTYTVLDNTDETGGGQSAAVCATVNITNGPKIFTLNNSPATSFRAIQVEEWSTTGGPSAGLDGHQGKATVNVINTGSFNAGTGITTTVNGDLIWSAYSCSTAGSSATAGSGFTNSLNPNPNSSAEGSEKQTQTSAGSIQGTWVNNSGSTNSWIANVLALKPNSGAATAPVVSNISDLPPRGTTYSEWQKWTQNGLTTLPIPRVLTQTLRVQQSWSNPPRTYWYQSVEDRGNVLLPRPTPFRPIDTYAFPPIYYNVNIWQETGNNSLPIPLTPQGQPFGLDLSQNNIPNLTWYQTWTWSGNSLTAITQNPFIQSNWPLSSPVIWYQSWTQSFQQVIPFKQTDWSLPKTYQPLLQTWSQSLNIFYQSETFPFVQNDWPNPQRIVWDRFWSQGPAQPVVGVPFFQTEWPNPKFMYWYLDPNIQNLLGTTLTATVVEAQFDWRNPPQLPGLIYTWIYNPTILMGPTAPPFFQTDWPLPRTYQPIQQFWAEAGNVQLPFPTPFFQNVDFPTPVVSKPIDQTWLQNLLSFFQSNTFPFSQTDWKNPYPVYWFRDHNQNLVIYLPVGIKPFNQSDWPLPGTFKPIDQQWFQALVLNLPIPPAPPAIISSGRYITEAEVSAEVAQWWKRQEAASKPKLLTFSDMGKMGGRPRKHS